MSSDSSPFLSASLQGICAELALAFVIARFADDRDEREDATNRAACYLARLDGTLCVMGMDDEWIMWDEDEQVWD